MYCLFFRSRSSFFELLSTSFATPAWRREKSFQASCIWPSGRTAWRGWPKTLGIDSHAQNEMGKRWWPQKKRCWNCWWNMKLRWTSSNLKKDVQHKKNAAIFLSLVRVHWSAIPLSSFPYLSIRNLCTETPDAFQKNRPPETFRWTSQDAAHQKEQAKYYQRLGQKSLKDQNWPSLGFQIRPGSLGVLSKQTHVIFKNFCGLIDIATSLRGSSVACCCSSSSSDYRFCPCQWTVRQQQQQGNKTNTHNFNDLTTIIWKTIRERSGANITALTSFMAGQPTPRLTYPPRKKGHIKD